MPPRSPDEGAPRPAAPRSAAPRSGAPRSGAKSLFGRAAILLGGAAAFTALSGGNRKIRRHSQTGTSGRIGRGFHEFTPSPEAARAGHEVEDMSGALMGKLFLGLGVVVACTVALMVWYIASLSPPQNGPALTAQQTAPIEPPKPNLQAEPLVEINSLRHREQAELDTYAWVTPDHTRARIPLSRAKTLVLGHSLDTAP